MKLIATILLIMFFTVSFSTAEDVIVLRSGDIIKAKVSEVGTDNVKYKKTANLSGPTYTIHKSEILSITYENGDVDKFDTNTKKSNNSELASPSGMPSFEEPVTDDEDHIIKTASNIIFSPSSFFAKKRKAKKGVPIMWIDKNSVTSTADISMRIVGTICPSRYYKYVMRYYIELRNKSNSTIYVDKANSFRINDQDLATSFYDNKIISINRSSGSGTSVGLGGIANSLNIGGVVGNMASGISVGKGNSYGISTTHSDQRVLIIPPGGKAYISRHKYERIEGTNRWELISDAESYMFNVKSLSLYEDELKEYDESSSPYKVNYIVAFSKVPTFHKYSTLKLGLYAKYILGKSVEPSGMNCIPGYPESFETLKDVYKIYNKAIPNFENLFGKIIVGRNYRTDEP